MQSCFPLRRVGVAALQCLVGTTFVWLTSASLDSASFAPAAPAGGAPLDAPSAPAQSRRVVILYDERTELPGLASLDATLVQALTRGSTAPIDVYREAMDLSRFDSSDYALTLRDHLRAKYAGKELDVAIAVKGPALDFLLAHGDVAFPGTPIVFCGIDKRELGARALPAHVTGALVAREFLPTLELALALHPGIERVVFVGGTSGFDARLAEEAREEFRALEGRYAFTYLTAEPLDRLLAELASLPPHTLVLYSSLSRDGAGQACVPDEVVERIAAVANAPVYAFLEEYLGHGIVGGHLQGLEPHGEATANLALQVLAGKPPADLPPIEGRAGLDLFDWNQLQRWGIDAARLPPGAIIRFRPPTAWQHYRGTIAAAAVVVVLQTLLIVALLLQRTARRRAEAELRHSEERLRLAADAASLGIWGWLSSRDDMWASDNCRALHGLPRDGKISFGSFTEVVHPDDRDGLRRLVLEALHERRPFTAEYRVTPPGGEMRWIASRGRGTVGGAANPRSVLGVSVDVTERKLAEEALRASEERYREVVESQTDLISRYARDGTLTFVNPAYCRYFGRSREQLIGSSLLELVPAKERDFVRGVIEKLATEKQPITCEHQVVAADGAIRWQQWMDYAILASDGGVAEFQAIGRDITERKAMEESLRRSDERFQLVLRATKAAIYDWDVSSDALWWSQNGLRLFGYPDGQSLDHAWWTALLHPEDREPVTATLAAALAEGRTQWDAEYRLRRADGSYAHVTDRGYVVRDADGKPSRMIGSLLDVSDHKRLEEANAQLAHASRLAVLGELSASIAHEMNQPLGAILSNADAAEMLLARAEIPLQELRLIVEDLRRDALRAGEVIRAMRSMLRKRQLVFTPFELNRAIADVIELVGADLAKRRTKVTTSFSPLPAVRGDRVHVQQVVLNLVLNAVEAMADANASDRRIELATRRGADGEVEVIVSDSGPGIRPEHLPQLFEAFFTTRKNGMGLGLSIARSIVEAHGGRIQAGNRPEGGATIRFTLACGTERPAPANGPLSGHRRGAVHAG